MMDWDKLKTFHAAAEAGSLTGAAELLNLSQSAVSRQISALEDDLGVKLFHRHPRGLLLTEPGRLLFTAAHEMAAKVAAAESLVHDTRDEPTGLLRVTAPTAMGAIWLAPRLARFREAYPRIRVRLILADNELDIANLEADAAIRPWPATQNELIQRKLMDVSQHLYASQTYLKRRGAPADAAGLEDHDVIAYGPRHLAPIPNLNWHLAIGRPNDAAPREPVVEINTINGIMKAAEAGMGVTSLPDYVARENERLVRVLPDIEGPPFETYFIYPAEMKGSRRVTAFREFLVEEARRWQR